MIGVMAGLVVRRAGFLAGLLLRIVLALLLLTLLLITLLLRRVFVLVVHAFLHVRGQWPELTAAMEKTPRDEVGLPLLRG